MNGLTKAIKSAGTATNLATMLGIKPMSVSRWKNRYQGMVPADRVLQIYAARGMKIEDIKNVAVFFNMNGKTVALRMDAEQKRIVALMALNTADARAELIEVPHMTLPADPAMEEAAQ